MTAPRRLAVCADDYGLGPAIDRGILALVAQRRITALSCLVTLPRWREAGASLQGCGAAAGLHVNLTEGEPLSAALRDEWPRFPALGVLLARAFAGRLPAAVAGEFDAQLQRFIDVTGRVPAFIDGHQHVHALPGMRPLVLAAARRLGVPVRNTGHVVGPGFAAKRRIIEACGGRALAGALRSDGIAHAPALVGVYGFDPRADYRVLVQRWLARVPDGALLFCHPALGEADAGDPIAAARTREHAYLASSAFADDLAAAGVSLG
ncbi:ChbG/HpnK family deacetylase [Pelomonas cellulosilytica]|uniref:ChbG/HpnK family deacetylase n=1 Tax=Pelomonas cellulosilytica TaxID=2906762 RepID=A0ABS8XXP9_9BURK|nr:ChbG/HpnK family deacetylase [Pelomonas sp. P8]MCE4554085.1 ChbG/HpnK family deacetylase [Pelomonas sp. P8]